MYLLYITVATKNVTLIFNNLHRFLSEQENFKKYKRFLNIFEFSFRWANDQICSSSGLGMGKHQTHRVKIWDSLFGLKWKLFLQSLTLPKLKKLEWYGFQHWNLTIISFLLLKAASCYLISFSQAIKNKMIFLHHSRSEIEFKPNNVSTCHIQITLISKGIEIERRAFAHLKENSKIFNKLINFTHFTMGNKDLSPFNPGSNFLLSAVAKQ